MLKLELRAGEKEGGKKALGRFYSGLPVLKREKMKRVSVRKYSAGTKGNGFKV